MRISNFAVKNYQFTLVIFLMTIALGLTTFLNMPRSEDPATDGPQFPVIVVYPGTSPADMEELVVDPLEKRIYALEDIKKIKTTISSRAFRQGWIFTRTMRRWIGARPRAAPTETAPQRMASRGFRGRPT